MPQSVSPSALPGGGTRRPPLYEPLDFVQVRLPLFPVEAYLGLHQGVDADERALRFGHPLVRRAIAVGSLDLFDELERNSAHPRDSARRESRLLRYLIRMATRPTPYGLFAGVALAHWGEQTDLSVANLPSAQARPDMGWLMNLVWKLEALPEVRRHLCFVANTAAFIRRGRIFLLEELPGGKPKPASEVSVKATGVAVRALALARRSIPYPRLVEALLTSTPGATLDKVETLISTLWQHTLLFTDLRLPLTAGHPVEYLQRRLATLPAMAPLLAELQDYLEAVEKWSASLEEEGVATYRSLLERAREIEDMVDEMSLAGQGGSGEKQLSSSGPPGSRRGASLTPLQIDLAWPLGGARVARAVGEEVAAATDVLLRLSPLPYGDPHLAAYRQAFLERYGEQREVPLLELLDPQFGLGPPVHYTSNKVTPVPAQNRDAAREVARNQTLLHCAMSALRDHRLTVQLDEGTLERLETCSPSPAYAPASLDLYVFVAASSAQAVDAGEFRLVLGPNVGALQAGRNLGRFARLLGPEADAALKLIARREEAQAPEQIWAELVYLPKRNRMANVLIRPLVRRQEIVYGGVPGGPETEVIPLDEIAIGVRNGRFSARWAPKNAEVSICVGHMLNPAGAPTVVRFLSDLAHDGKHHLSSFDWGRAEQLPFLPRVELGRTILEPARWTITPVMHLPEFSMDSPERFRASLEGWRERWNVPRYVYPSVFDNRLLLDLECPRQLEELRTDLRRLKDGERLIVYEGLPGPTDAWVEGPAGHYLAEFVVSLALRQPETRREQDSPIPLSTAETPQKLASLRLRPLGSEWLYMKLYCALALQDALLAGPLRDFAHDALAARYAEDWFFIRYADPDPHIRLRFRGEPDVLLRQLLPELSALGRHLMSEGPCLKFTFDVYDREIERYGGPAGILAAEALFGADSRAVVDLLHLLRTQKVQVDRVVLAVLSIDDLLTQLGLIQALRLQWYRDHVPLHPESGREYRQKSRQLRSLLGRPDALSIVPGGEMVEPILAARRATVARVSQLLSEAMAQRTVSQPLPGLYRSFVHMHCNRLLGVDRATEQGALELLLRTQEGLARAPLQ